MTDERIKEFKQELAQLLSNILNHLKNIHLNIL